MYIYIYIYIYNTYTRGLLAPDEEVQDEEDAEEDAREEERRQEGRRLPVGAVEHLVEAGRGVP